MSSNRLITIKHVMHYLIVFFLLFILPRTDVTHMSTYLLRNREIIHAFIVVYIKLTKENILVSMFINMSLCCLNTFIYFGHSS